MRHQQLCHMHLKQQQQPLTICVVTGTCVQICICFLFPVVCLPYLTPACCSMKRLPSIGVSQVHACSPLQQQLCSLHVAICCCDVELQGQRRNSIFPMHKIYIRFAIRAQYAVWISYWSHIVDAKECSTSGKCSPQRIYYSTSTKICRISVQV